MINGYLLSKFGNGDGDLCWCYDGLLIGYKCDVNWMIWYVSGLLINDNDCVVYLGRLCFDGEWLFGNGCYF